MNSNKFVYSVIAVLISVVFIGSCLAPVVMDAVTGDKQTITLSNDDTGATTFVYKLAAADSIVGNISTGEYTITAGGTDYTTTTDPLLINPDEGIIAPDIQNKYITVYGADGIEQQILVTEATQVACSYSTTWFVASNGKVYGCGSNSYGQQGSGDTTNVTTFTDRTPEGKTVTQVACSINATWIITQDGKVYGCGSNSYGQQGSGDTTNVTTFTDRTPEGKTVTNVFSSGNTATWIITQDGKVYGCGQNTYGQQGSGTSGSGTNVTTFTDRTPEEKTVTQVASSENTTWIVTQDGKVYGCGQGNNGQQGSGDTTNVTTFTDRTPEGKTVTQLACANSTTWIITQDGKVYGCGANNNGQQGSGGTNNVTTFTDRTPSGKTVTQVACNLYDTWFMTQDGKVYGSGQNTYGQQGSGNTTDVKTFTDRTPSGKTVTQVACSQYTTWIITQDGKVYGCGQGNNGQQGSGDTTNVTTFTDRTPESPNTFTIDNKADYYLITDAADIPNQYLYITDASTGYYADPSEAVVFTYGADSYFVSVGATAGSHYGTLPTLATVNGTDTQLSPGYRVYQYSDSFPVTADGASTGLAGFVELEYQGEVGQGGLDPTFGTLLVLTVTFAIIGVVLAAVRMIGGRE